jgi:hypothetical protein
MDYSCGGKSLKSMCDRRGLDPAAVLERLQSTITNGPAK